MKKPFQDEIVKGTDTSGRTFSEGRVTDSSNTESAIRLPNGSDTCARHTDIRPQVDLPGSKKKV